MCAVTGTEGSNPSLSAIYISDSMSYQVLSLKYRPQTFKEVVGQNHVTTTLTNAISSDRVAHAILFAGPRGTGKTSIARILAKAMNCESGPAPNPCNKCRSCTAITDGNSPDVLEIDGASNNSVDQIRELRSNVTYRPSMSAFKIYIIDEVHMLSTAAFNALLKTLEEPPDHVLFIFATTEPHKIPVTILSRCQRHDLGRIPLSLIANQLQTICKKEGYTIPEESLDIIASEADGSMRDSLSLLDRVMSSTGEKTISHETVLNNLGVIDKKILFNISKAIIDSDGSAIIQLIEKVHDLGLDLKKFYSDIIKQFRNFVIIKICTGNIQFADISESDQKIIKDMVSHLSKGYLTGILNTLIKEESTIKFASHAKIALEMTLLRLLQIRQGVDIDEIIVKLNSLVKNYRNNKTKSSVKRARLHNHTTENHTAGNRTAENRTAGISHENNQTGSCAEKNNLAEKSNQMQQETQLQYQPPAQHDLSKQPAVHDHSDNQYQNDPVNKLPQQLQADDEQFKKFSDEVKNTFPFISVALSRLKLEKITETHIILKGNLKSGDLSRIESRMKNLKQIIEKFFNRPLEIQVINTSSSEKPSLSAFNNKKKTPAQARKEILNHPLVAEAIKMFNGSIADIKTEI